MPTNPNIPLPGTPIGTPQGWRIWWRVFRNLASSTQTIIDSGGDSAQAQLGEFEAQIADLQNRLRAVEARFQVFAMAALRSDANGDRVMGLMQRVDALEKLAPVPNPGVFSGLTITGDGGLAFQGQTSDAGASIGTLTNAPHAANPVFWVKGVINGTQIAIPAWAA